MRKKQSKRVLGVLFFFLIGTSGEYRSPYVFPSIDAHQRQLIVSKKIAYINFSSESFYGADTVKNGMELLRNFLLKSSNNQSPSPSGMSALARPVLWNMVLSHLKPIILPFVRLYKFVEFVSYMIPFPRDAKAISTVTAVASSAVMSPCLITNRISFSSGVIAGYTAKTVEVKVLNLSNSSKLAKDAEDSLAVCNREQLLQAAEMRAMKRQLHQSTKNLEEAQDNLSYAIQNNKNHNAHVEKFEINYVESEKDKDREKVHKVCKYGLDVLDRKNTEGHLTSISYRCATENESWYYRWLHPSYLSFIFGAVSCALTEFALYKVYCYMLPPVQPPIPQRQIVMSTQVQNMMGVFDQDLATVTPGKREAARKFFYALGDSLQETTLVKSARHGIRLCLDNVGPSRSQSNSPHTQTQRSAGSTSSTRSEHMYVSRSTMEGMRKAGWEQEAEGPRILVKAETSAAVSNK